MFTSKPGVSVQVWSQFSRVVTKLIKCASFGRNVYMVFRCKPGFVWGRVYLKMGTACFEPLLHERTPNVRCVGVFCRQGGTVHLDGWICAGSS